MLAKLRKINIFIVVFFTDVLALMPGYIVGGYSRKLFYNLLMKKAGKGLKIRRGTVIYSPQNIVLGNDVRFNNDCWINGGGGISFGNNVIVGPKVVIHSANHRISDLSKPIMYQGHESKKVVIEDNVWIGAGAIILPGVKISSGAVVGAGAVVTNDIAENCVVGGNPAKWLKNRG